jgi:chloramphenicol O-acetyltransferase type A
VPWVAFTQVVQPVPSPGDCNPRIVFGKYMQEKEKTLMPLHIQCNHALVDGYHISEFYRIFQQIHDEL